MRSFLTMLGIIIGVGAVIIPGQHRQRLYVLYDRKLYPAWASTRITVSYVAMPSRSIDVDEFYDFYMENSDLYQQMTPTVSVSATVKHGSDTMDSTSVGGYGKSTWISWAMESEPEGAFCIPIWPPGRRWPLSATMWPRSFTEALKTAVGETIKINGTPTRSSGSPNGRRRTPPILTTAVPMISFGFLTPGPSSCPRNANITSYTFTSWDTDSTDACTEALESFCTIIC